MPKTNDKNLNFLTDLRSTPKSVNRIIRTLINDTLADIYLGSVQVKESDIVNETGVTKFKIVLLNNRTGGNVQHSRHWKNDEIVYTDESITEMIEVEVRLAAAKFSIKTSKELLKLIEKGTGHEEGIELGLTEILRSMLSTLKNPHRVKITSSEFRLAKRAFHMRLTMSGPNGDYRHEIVLDLEDLINTGRMHDELNKELTKAIKLGSERGTSFGWEFYPPQEQKMHRSVEDILKFFKYDHLPPNLQEISKPLCEMAKAMAIKGKGPELTVALRKLLEAKDCFVRSVL